MKVYINWNARGTHTINDSPIVLTRVGFVPDDRACEYEMPEELWLAYTNAEDKAFRTKYAILEFAREIMKKTYPGANR